MATGSGRGSEAMDGEDWQAYQDYMLRGSKTNSNKKTPSPKVPFTSPPDRSSSSPRAKWKDVPSPSQRQKHLRLLYRSFRSSVQEWIDTDDQLLQVSRSIANLRDRIWVTSRALTALHDEQQQHQPAVARDWMRHGYRPSGPPSPPPEIVLQIALSDALVQHEKMLALLRQLLSQLSQDQDAMGRRVEDLFLLTVDGEEKDLSQRWNANRDAAATNDENSNVSWETDPVQGCVELHAACARELYRKQGLAQRLLDSTANAMLYAGSAGLSDGWDGNNDELAETDRVDEQDAALQQSPPPPGHRHPRALASFCARRWSRASRASELFAFREKLGVGGSFSLD